VLATVAPAAGWEKGPRAVPAALDIAVALARGADVVDGTPTSTRSAAAPATATAPAPALSKARRVRRPAVLARITPFYHYVYCHAQVREVKTDNLAIPGYRAQPIAALSSRGHPFPVHGDHLVAFMPKKGRRFATRSTLCTRKARKMAKISCKGRTA
jgi:hypothetical protein